MSTSLILITDSCITKSREERLSILKKLNDLELTNTSSYSIEDKKWIEEQGKWKMEIDNYTPFNIYFSGRSCFFITLYENVGVIHTIFKYKMLYQMSSQPEYLENFRREVFSILNAIGGQEIIYLADNGCHKLSVYDNMATDNTPYAIIKEKMIEEIGFPISDYTQLRYNDLDYKRINEFFLDDFKDLKR